MSRKVGELQIDDDRRFLQNEWRFQRVGIAILGAFVIAAALGFTGMGGPAAHAEAGEPGGPLHVEYDRFVRRGARARMTLHFHQDPPGFIQFWIDAPYLERVMIDGVAPTPETVTVEDSRHVYTIRAASPDVAVAVEMEHQTSGSLEAKVGIVGGPTVTFWQLSLF